MSEKKYPIGGYAPDSDARAQAPIFDEIVGLIEKLFKDSLEMTKAFTAEEIEQGWQRYKTLNHLYQDEIPQQGSVWVKASDRLPGCERAVRWRHAVTKVERANETFIELYQLRPASFGVFEWLDESGQSKEGDTKINREWINNALVEFALSYNRRPNKDIANDAAEYLHDKLKEAGIEYVLCEEEKEVNKEPEWDSERLIGRVKDRFKELEAKQWDWRSFYNGWLEGRSDMLQQIKGWGQYKPEQKVFPMNEEGKCNDAG